MISAARSTVSRLYKTFPSSLPNGKASSNFFAFTATSPNIRIRPIQTMSTTKEFVEDTIRDNKIVIFSKSYCPHSRASKAYFAENFPDEEVIAVELDKREDTDEIQDYLKKKTGTVTSLEVTAICKPSPRLKSGA
ncbi:hypothetical protein V8B97DRAFT_751602 [Scleroderma yunnanense]